MMMVVVPFSRREREGHVRATLKRLRCEERAVIVENGSAIGCFPNGPWTVLTSSPSAGAARNQGLNCARDAGARWVTFLDDDDYYGPNYLLEREQECERDEADAFHKGIGLVRFEDGLYLFDNQKRYYCLISSSLTVRTSIAPDFPDLSGGEEIAWTRMLRERGGRERTLPPWGFVYNRQGMQHAYAATRVQMLRAYGPARRLGSVPDEAADMPLDVMGLPTEPKPSDGEVFEDLRRLLEGFR